MYCINCGVELQQGAERCPLCGLRVYHPDLSEQPEAAPYPPRTAAKPRISRGGLLFIVTLLFLVPLLVCLFTDLGLNGRVSWSGFVLVGLPALYVMVCLPLWFRRANPVIFFPTAMAAALLLALYICLSTGGRWFLSFALPVGGLLTVIAEAVIVLLRHTVGPHRHRALYILGGALIALGGACMLIEALLSRSFGLAMRWWSLYPMGALGLLGALMLVIGLCRPLRKSLYKRMFI